MDAAELAGLDAGLAPIADELIELRRRLHAHPEPAWEEHATTEAIVEHLRASGLEPRVAKAGTGVLCDVGHAGPLVALRGDIDALRIADRKEVPYRSTVPGVCHACGHDLHTAAVLGAGLLLAPRLAGGRGRVRLIFQPAEEAIPSGAPRLIAEGAMDDVAVVLSLHADPSHPVGTIAVSAGPVTSTADQLEIRLHGPGGHTGRPHQTVDLAHVAARIVLDLPAALSRLTDPRDGVNLTFGAVQLGHAANVVPTEARLLASLRTTGRSAWEAAPPLIERVVAGIADPLGAGWELVHQRGAPPIVNDLWAVGIVERTARQLLGDDHVVPTVQSGGGEDFAWYGEHAPVCYFRLGVAAPGAAPVDLHSGAFDVDESAIGVGARLLAASALGAIDDLARGADGQR